MRNKIYHILVNRQSGIRERYHRMHDGTGGICRILSWVYLIWLNLCYYVFFCRFLGRSKKTAIYEEKRIPYTVSESQKSCCQCHHILEQKQSIQSGKNEPFYSDKMIESYVNYLSGYDVISFDLFDTLIFRPFSAPQDLFFLMGEKLDFLDFKRIRMEIEALARQKKFQKDGNYEVTLSDIWRLMEQETGIRAGDGESLECQMEETLCYANPFMQRIFRELRKRNKPIIVVTDMYLPQVCLYKILSENGYEGIRRLYISSAYGQSKWDGSLHRRVLADIEDEFGKKVRVVHVGDNYHSDVKMAERNKITAMQYVNTDMAASVYRAQDMSPVIGGAYRGIVNHSLYSGLCSHSIEYEYGFVYGGLFAVGYCRFIHDYVKDHGIDRVLFLSRDGDILRQVYTMLYPDEETRYVYWSRAAALKLTADENRYDFFRRFLYHKVNQGKKIGEVLREMELEELIPNLPMEETTLLNSENVELVKKYLQTHWEAVLSKYSGQSMAAGRYYAQMLSGCQKAAAVDIGWAGSGAMALRILLKQWQIPCDLVGILAGTNSINNAEPETSEAQLQSGKLISYLFSQTVNRDVLKKHDPAADDNVYWELLLSSPTRQFLGFYPSADGMKLRFGKMPQNHEGCREIQRGILDFACEYVRHFKDWPYMLSISGRDACAPMLAAYGSDRKYLKTIAAHFALDIAVSCDGESVDVDFDIMP